MLHADLLMGRFERVDPVTSVRSGRLVRATSPGGPTCVLLLARDAEVLAAEREMLARVAGPGVPTAHVVTDDVSGRSALRLDVPDDVQPLGSSTELPPATLREGLTQMLRVLSRAHRRGRVHGALSQGSVLVSEDGRFWLTAWGGAGELGEDAGDGGFSAVARDVRDLGAAFVHALLGPDERDDETPRVPSVADLGGTGADRDFRRVLSRLLAPDPRDAYASAAEVLVDLGSPDTLDPWQSASFVERGDAVQRIAGALDGADEVGSAVGAVEIVGPHGSGRTRLLGAAAAALRARGALVLPADAAGAPWGGLASLARQLTQLVGRESPTWREHQLVLQQVVEDGCVPTDGLVLPAATAIAALAEAAFAEGYGALLVDDADTMLPNAAETWRSLRRQAGARLGRRVLFVSTRRHLAEVADDVQAEVVTIGDWSVAEVTKFLEGVLVSADLAAAAAPIFRDLAGGRPGEIVGLMRDLERSGSLSRIGERWQLEVPLHALPDWTPQDSEEVRRCMRAAGRDAAALVEVLAVARQPVARDDCGRLAELPGPRLWTAAEAAETAGLIRREGSTWRIRSEHIRSRVASAMGRTRRRSLHREVLELLRRTAPDELGAQAYHARASGHPDASDLTRRAVDHLVSVGRYDSAVAQLVEAEESLGDPAWGRAAWAERIDLLRYAGRLGEALDLADRLLAHPETADAERADALVRRIHVLYESRDWDGVVNQELPETTATPEQLSELRYMRAAAYATLGESLRGGREFRLAEAEGGRPDVAEVLLARLEAAYKAEDSALNLPAAAGALLARLRVSAAAPGRHRVPFDFCRLATLAPEVCSTTQALRVQERAAEAIACVREGARHTRAALLHVRARTRAKLTGYEDPEEHQRFATLYEETGARILVSTGRQRRTFTRVVTRQYDGSDHALLASAGRAVTDASPSELMAWSHGLAAAMELLGYQPSLEEFGARIAAMNAQIPRVQLVLKSVLRSRLLWSDPPGHPLDATCAPVVANLLGTTAEVQPTTSPDLPHSPALGAIERRIRGMCVAWEIRSGRRLGLPDLEDRGGDSVWRAAPRSEIGAADLCLALARGIWRSEEVGDEEWRWIAWARGAYDGSWFPQLRWQAHLLDCKLHWRAGRLAAAAASAARAVEQAEWLLVERFGEWGVREHALAARTIAERAPRDVLRDAGIAANPAARRANAPTRAPRRALHRPLPPLGDERVIVLAGSAGDLARYLDRALELRVRDALVPGTLLRNGVTVVLLPELMERAEVRQALDAVRRAHADRTRLVVATALNDHEIQHAPVGVRILLELAAGVRIRLAGTELQPEDRVRALLSALRRERAGLGLSVCARAVAAAYSWPGGASEVQAVARGAAARASRQVSAEVLVECGVQPLTTPGAHNSLIVRAISGGDALSVSDLVTRTGMSRRTIQRRLRELVAASVIERSGSGRGARYRSPSAQA